MATSSQIQSRGVHARTIVRLSLAAIAIAVGAFAYGSSMAAAPPAQQTIVVRVASHGKQRELTARPFSYGWPVKPFDRQHPVRGYFGDPRSVFEGDPTTEGLMHSNCACFFHEGIDISVPDGTAVYPVKSGVVRAASSHWIVVDSGDGVSFQYWHIIPLVQVGDHVTAEETVLGHTQKAMKHVHLTQLQDNHPVNPLGPGNLGPYVDTTIPRVNRVSFRSSDSGPELLPEYLHGRVELIADAADTPAMPVPGLWANLPVSPARVSFRIETVPQRVVVIPTTTARDVRRELPGSRDMWATYARGSHMNMVKMGDHRYWYEPGAYLFKLAGEGFDTRRLHDGVYALVVTATDASGNESSTTQIVNIHNRANWLG